MPAWRNGSVAGLYPAGVICEIMNEDGTMARVPQLINDYAAKINEIGMSPLKGFA